MKIHLEPSLDYQLQAIEAVCDLFRDQEICRTELTVIRDATDLQTRMSFAQNDLGIGNRLTLIDARGGQALWKIREPNQAKGNQNKSN